MSSRPLRILAFSFASCLCGVVLHGAELVNIKEVDPTIEVELRYAGTRNVTGRPLYRANTLAMLRPSVAARLLHAQSYLQVHGFRLKIWDAYRPKDAHDQLWQVSRNTDFVANPADGLGSLHSWGVAVDATLVYEDGREVAMPTDFDDFTPAAMLRYVGPDQNIRKNLLTLQRAMARAGFYGLRTEWWHFVAKDWQKYRAVREPGAVSPAWRPTAPATPRAGVAGRGVSTR